MMTNRQKYYSDKKYSSMTDEELGKYINPHVYLRGRCDDFTSDSSCSMPCEYCEQCCIDWLSEEYVNSLD